MIPIFEPSFGRKEREYLTSCIDTGWISSQGRFIGEFEAAFADTAGMPFGVATSSCTTALHLALVALGIAPGDEVICPDLTFIAPANMIALCGATPVLVDVEPDSWALDPNLIEAKIGPKTKALVVVHPFGHSADMDPIMKICARHGVPVIEDVAEAPGATYRGQTVGSFGVMSCYSFFANKIMTTGEGGIVLTRDRDLDTKLRVLRDHGMSREKRYVHVAAGFNYRMTNMQAAVGLGQLERLDDILERRRRQEDHYRRRLSGHSRVRFRPVRDYCQHVHWMTTATLQDIGGRDALLAHLAARGIDARQMIFPIHEAVPYAATNDPDQFPVTMAVSHGSFHLPSGLDLKPETIDMICDEVLEWVAAQ